MNTLTSPGLQDPLPAISRACWLQLMCAEAVWLLCQQEIRALVIKGETLNDWLYPDRSRPASDVDLLVEAERFEAAVRALEGKGFRKSYPGLRRHEATPHAVTLNRDPAQYGRHQLDLHSYFPGIGLAAQQAFETLWEGRVPSEQAAIPVSFPDVPARIFLSALHAARDPNSKTRQDLQRIGERANFEQLFSAKQLAIRLDAEGPFKAGLQVEPSLSRVVERLALNDIDITPEWNLRASGADPIALRLIELNQLPWWRRPSWLARLLFISPEALSLREEGKPRGPLQLSKAYTRRIAAVARRLPTAIRQVRRASR